MNERRKEGKMTGRKILKNNENEDRGRKKCKTERKGKNGMVRKEK